MQTITESQAIETAKSDIKNLKYPEGWVLGIMTENDLEDFIWGYLYDKGLQYKKPIYFIHENGHKCAVLVYKEG